MSFPPLPLPDSVSTWAIPAGGIVTMAALTRFGYLLGRRRQLTGAGPRDRAPRATSGPGTPADGRRWEALETVLTLAAAGIATAVAVNGMWRVFGDALGFTGPGRIALAGFLEIALMVSAIRARRSLRQTGSVGVDGAAVWAMAGLSAVLAAADAEGLARAFRFIAPLVAAWLWERGMAADRRAARPPSPRDPIAWRLTRHRLAIRLGLADPTHRPGTDVDRAHRLARLTRARLRLAVLETSPIPRPLAVLTLHPLRHAVAARRLQRQALAAVEHLRLGTDPTITAAITTTVAAVVGLRDATAPDTLARTTDPWPTGEAITGSDPVPVVPSTPVQISTAPDPVPALPVDPHPSRIGSTAHPTSDPILDNDEHRSTADRIPIPAAVEAAATDRTPVQARAEDVARLRQAIGAAELPAHPSVDAVRRHLKISPAYARAARAAISSTTPPPVITPESPAENSTEQPEQSETKARTQELPRQQQDETPEGPIPLRINHFSRNLTDRNPGDGTNAVRLP